MRSLYPIVAGILIFTAVAYASIPRTDRNSLEAAIADAANTAKSGVSISWTGSGSNAATITLEKAYSRATKELCDSCSDPCRAVNYQVTTPQAVTDFHGVRCMSVDGAGSIAWKKEGADTVVRNLAIARPTPKLGAQAIARPVSTSSNSRKLAIAVQDSLKRLMYYTGPIDGDFGAISKSALTDFLNDERSTLDPHPSQDVVTLLTAAQQRIVHTTCPRVDGVKDFHEIACATVSG